MEVTVSVAPRKAREESDLDDFKRANKKQKASKSPPKNTGNIKTSNRFSLLGSETVEIAPRQEEVNGAKPANPRDKLKTKESTSHNPMISHHSNSRVKLLKTFDTTQRNTSLKNEVPGKSPI